MPSARLQRSAGCDHHIITAVRQIDLSPARRYHIERISARYGRGTVIESIRHAVRKCPDCTADHVGMKWEENSSSIERMHFRAAFVAVYPNYLYTCSGFNPR